MIVRRHQPHSKPQRNACPGSVGAAYKLRSPPSAGSSADASEMDWHLTTFGRVAPLGVTLVSKAGRTRQRDKITSPAAAVEVRPLLWALGSWHSPSLSPAKASLQGIATATPERGFSMEGAFPVAGAYCL